MDKSIFHKDPMLPENNEELLISTIKFYKKKYLTPLELYGELPLKKLHIHMLKSGKYRESGKSFFEIFTQDKAYVKYCISKKKNLKGELGLFRHYIFRLFNEISLPEDVEEDRAANFYDPPSHDHSYPRRLPSGPSVVVEKSAHFSLPAVEPQFPDEEAFSPPNEISQLSDEEL